MQMVRRCCLVAVTALAVLIGAASAQAQATKLLPNDTELVLTINLKQILTSEVAKANKTLLDFAKQAIEQKLEDNPSSKYLKKANFNFLTDLHSISVAMPVGRDFGEGMIVLQGKFDAEKIEEAATEASKEAGGGLKIIEIANTKVFQVTPREDEKTIYVGVLDKKTMIACTSKTDFATAVARLSGSQAASFKAEFKSAVGALSNKQSISIAATSAALLKLMDKLPDAAAAQADKASPILKQLDGFSAFITIQKDIDFQIGVNTKDAETANQYAAASKAGLEFAKKLVGDKAKDDEKAAAALAVINSIQATATGVNLVIRGQISADTLEKILQLLPIPGN
jgi:hypothetical protein